MLTACKVSKIILTVPFAGEVTRPSLGIIATPFPSISDENVSSGTSFIDILFPAIGLKSVSFFFLKNPNIFIPPT